VEFARELRERGIEILSTGGTANLLVRHGISVKEVAAHTGFPEIMGAASRLCIQRFMADFSGAAGWTRKSCASTTSSRSICWR